MARLILLLLMAACDEGETTAFRQDLAVHLDLWTPPCSAGTGTACDESPLNWCSPTPFSTNICVCTRPTMEWFCCDVENYVCPLAPQTGDFCCPLQSGNRICGNCVCQNGQFVCGNIDMGGRD
jgi:hypothetical protein